MATARRSKNRNDVRPRPQIEEVAHGGLKERLTTAPRLLPATASASINDLKAVHQLRVATRRALAALDVFSQLIPPRRAAWLRKQLKRIRRAAGEARDLDVLAQRLRRLVAARPGGRYDALLASAERLRSDRRRPIRRLDAKLAGKDFSGHVRSLLQRVRVRRALARSGSQAFECFARRKLSGLVDDFFAAAGENLHDLAALHAFRIAAKRLRYAMEMLSGAFPEKSSAALYRAIERLQTKLGEANDHRAVLKILARWPEKADDLDLACGLAALDRRERRGLERDHRRLLRWWNPARRDRLAARFQAMLAEPRSFTAGCPTSG